MNACPPAGCPGDAACLSLVDNAGKTSFGLRVGAAKIARPGLLTTGPLGTTIASDASPSLPSCGLSGSATFSLLLKFDLAQSTVEIGGAKPVADPTKGYAFVDEMVTFGALTFHVQPVTTPMKLGAQGQLTASMPFVIVPVYLDAMASEVVLLPLRSSSFVDTTLSSSRDCIGTYNGAVLDPSKQCAPDATHSAFTDGGILLSIISLEDADAIPVSSMGETMCVVLSGNASLYGDGATPIAHCKRDATYQIVFQGDACSMIGQNCADAVSFELDFAASGVTITN